MSAWVIERWQRGVGLDLVADYLNALESLGVTCRFQQTPKHNI